LVVPDETIGAKDVHILRLGHISETEYKQLLKTLFLLSLGMQFLEQSLVLVEVLSVLVFHSINSSFDGAHRHLEIINLQTIWIRLQRVVYILDERRIEVDDLLLLLIVIIAVIADPFDSPLHIVEVLILILIASHAFIFKTVVIDAVLDALQVLVLPENELKQVSIDKVLMKQG
jgi:hypothetical protein